MAAFTSATGSAGTIAAGDRLKEQFGTKIVAVEALECPTMLENGFGEHNIQGIGDKHIPLIHNVTNTDVVVAVSDHATDELDVLFNTGVGRAYLADRKGCRLEYALKARVRAVGEWGATIDRDDPLALVELYRSKGAGFVADLLPVGDEPDRRALHDAIRRRYNVIMDRDGVILAELVEKRK